jgi:hypothetical protein
MFKFTFFFLTLIITGVACRAQDIDTLLKHKRYNAINSNNYVQEMRQVGDSIIVTFKKDSVFKGKDIYQVTHLIPRGEYTVALIKMSPLSTSIITPKGRQNINIPLYGVFVFRFEKDNTRLLVLHDGRLWLTEREAADAYAAIRLSGEYFNTWYVSGNFARFVRYPNFTDADSLTVEKVALDWLKKLEIHRDKKLNTYTPDRTGADYGRDNFTKVLVNNHLNPMAVPADFDKMLKKYHLMLMPKNGHLPIDSTASKRNAGKTISD